jgi:DMSO reductase family type II enzyme heme b subunit
MVLRAARAASAGPLLDPLAPAWSAARAAKVALAATPLGLQPTGYVRAAWTGRAYGLAGAVEVACAHDGERLLFRLRWSDASETFAGPDAFPDAAAVALPVRGDPVLALMGAPEAPLHLLLWQAGREPARSILATGIGSTRPGPDVGAEAHATWKAGAWSVVIARRLAAPADAAPLAAGAQTGVGFAVWDGANGERAGIKAFSGNWIPLELGA